MPPLNFGASKPTVFLFGPLSRSLSQSNLTSLRTTILSSQQHAWVKDVITSLSTQYQILISEHPSLHDSVSENQIDNLKLWLETADQVLDIEKLPNTLLAPLVVIAQLVQYSVYITGQSAVQEQPVLEETSGFCIGLLSAFAVALSHQSTGTEFEKNAGAAVRLAMLAGAVVDKQHPQDTRSSSKTLSVAWKRAGPTDKSEDLDHILAKFPEVSSLTSLSTPPISPYF